MIYASKGRAPVPEEPSMFWPWAFLFGAVFGGVGIAIARWWAKDFSAKGPRVLLGLWHVFVGMIFGLPGLILVLFHLTDHKITYYNMNFFVANPLTFLALPLGFAIGWGSWRAVRLMRLSWSVLAGMSIVGLILMPFVAQDTVIPVAMLLPLNFAGAFAFHLLREYQPAT